MPRKAEDLTDRKFYRLKAILKHSSVEGRVHWECLCDPEQGGCGNIVIVAAAKLKKGNTRSCGCFQKDASSEANTKHGYSQTEEYNIWSMMLERCYNPDHVRYHRYGGRGIGVCAEWKDDFMAFYRDMGQRPSPKHSIDRIENDKDYCKDNCRWADKFEQANNRTNNILHEFNGEKKSLAEWCRELNLNYMKVYYRLSKGLPFEEAIAV